MPGNHNIWQSPDDQLAELLELTPTEAEDFCRFVSLRGVEGTVDEVRDWVLAMIELYRGQAAAIVTDYQASHTITLWCRRKPPPERRGPSRGSKCPLLTALRRPSEPFAPTGLRCDAGSCRSRRR